MIKAKAILTAKASFISFEKRLPIRGVKTQLTKQKIRKDLIEKGYQMFNPIIFIPENTLLSIAKKLKKEKDIINFEIDLSEILGKSSFSILKEKLLKELTK